MTTITPGHTVRFGSFCSLFIKEAKQETLKKAEKLGKEFISTEEAKKLSESLVDETVKRFVTKLTNKFPDERYKSCLESVQKDPEVWLSNNFKFDIYFILRSRPNVQTET